jgi:hypothetical protein
MRTSCFFVAAAALALFVGCRQDPQPQPYPQPYGQPYPQPTPYPQSYPPPAPYPQPPVAPPPGPAPQPNLLGVEKRPDGTCWWTPPALQPGQAAAPMQVPCPPGM